MDRCIEKVKLLLSEYEIPENDPLLRLQLELVIQEIKSDCNIDEVTDEMDYIVVNRCLGKYLSFFLQSEGPESLGIENSIRSISEGDVSYSFNTELGKDTLVADYIKYLTDFGRKALNSYRKMRW